MVRVYAWPPVAAVARGWTLEQPVVRSRSLLTGSEYLSSSIRKRRLARVVVHGRRRYGSGYMEALWRMLDGGANLVRVSICKIPWGKTGPDAARGERPFGWEVPSEAFGWETPPSPIGWIDDAFLTGTLALVEDVPVMTVPGLPPNSLVAIPGEFLTVHNDEVYERHMIAAPARSDSQGVAEVRLASLPSFSGKVGIGSRESAVFRLVSDWPVAMRDAGGTENYDLSFREVFADETDGFEEIYPWS